MKNVKKRQRGGRPADICRLDFHDFWGNLIDRIKGKVTEKNKGIEMMTKIEHSFGISGKDREDYEKKMLEWQRDTLTPTEVSEDLKGKQVKWTRDEKGRIISPLYKKQ